MGIKRLLLVFAFTVTLSQQAIIAVNSATPNEDAIECMKKGDSDCAVSVWKQQLALHPGDPEIQQNLVLALLFDTLQELDRGNLQFAHDSFSDAQLVYPQGPVEFSIASIWTYISEALDEYQSNLAALDMEYTHPFMPNEDAGLTAEYVEMTGFVADRTRVFALTPKITNGFYYYPIEQYPVDIAFRGSVYLSSQNGVVCFMIGGNKRLPSRSTAISLGWGFGDYYPSWRINSVNDGQWSEPIQSGPLDISPGEWVSVEVRTIGKTIELFVNRQLIGTATVFSYQPGYLAFGVELTVGGTGAGFTAAFDDISIYQLKT